MKEEEYNFIQPDHYKGKNGLDVLDIIKANSIGFELANALKYIVRAGAKPNQDFAQDMQKAKQYLELMHRPTNFDLIGLGFDDTVALLNLPPEKAAIAKDLLQANLYKSQSWHIVSAKLRIEQILQDGKI